MNSTDHQNTSRAGIDPSKPQKGYPAQLKHSELHASGMIGILASDRAIFWPDGTSNLSPGQAELEISGEGQWAVKIREDCKDKTQTNYHLKLLTGAFRDALINS